MYKEEEEARKQKERRKGFEQYMEEQPDQYPKSFLLNSLPTGCKTEREQEEDEAKKEIEIHKKKVNEKARINEKISYPSLLYKYCVKKDAYNVANLRPALLF